MNSELEKLLKQQIEVCKEATDFVVSSSDLMKRAVTRIYELESLIYDMIQLQDISQDKKTKKKKKKSKKNNDK